MTTTVAAAPAPLPAATVTVAATTTQSVQSVSASAPTPSNASAASQPTGGVLGAQTTLGKPKAKSGVLGTVANVAGTSLPFTGFPVWLTVLIALAATVAGFALYRRNAAARL